MLWGEGRSVRVLKRSWVSTGRSRWPRGLRCESVAARLLGLRIRIPPEAQTSVSCECRVLSGRGLYDGPIPPREKSEIRTWNCTKRHVTKILGENTAQRMFIPIRDGVSG